MLHLEDSPGIDFSNLLEILCLSVWVSFSGLLWCRSERTEVILLSSLLVCLCQLCGCVGVESRDKSLSSSPIVLWCCHQTKGEVVPRGWSSDTKCINKLFIIEYNWVFRHYFCSTWDSMSCRKQNEKKNWFTMFSVLKWWQYSELQAWLPKVPVLLESTTLQSGAFLGLCSVPGT